MAIQIRNETYLKSPPRKSRKLPLNNTHEKSSISV